MSTRGTEPWACRAPCDEFDAHREFLGGRDGNVADFAGAGHRRAAFGQTILGFDLVPVLVDHVIDAELGSAFLARFGEKNDVAVESDVCALEHEQKHQSRGHVVLVVKRAPAVDVAVAPHRFERLDRPVFALHPDDVGMSHDENRSLRTVAGQAGHEVVPPWCHGVQTAVDALGRQGVTQIVGDFGFVAGRVGGIDSQQGGEVAQRLFLHLGPVDRVAILA